MKKRLIIMSILLCFVVLLSSCSGDSNTASGDNASPSSAESQESQPQTEEDVSEVKEIQEHKEMMPSLAVIDGWNALEGSAALMQYIKDGNSVIVTCDRMPSDSENPEKFLEMVKENLAGAFGNITFSDTAEIGVSDPGKHYLAYVCDIKVGGATMQMKNWVAYIFYEGNAFTLTCGALSENFPGLEEDFRTFIESFKLVPKV
jgi:SepF-like predicted cell division protein (DUF552 family)